MKPFRLSKLPYEIYVTIATFTKSYSHTFSQKVASVLMTCHMLVIVVYVNYELVNK